MYPITGVSFLFFYVAKEEQNTEKAKKINNKKEYGEKEKAYLREGTEKPFKLGRLLDY